MFVGSLIHLMFQQIDDYDLCSERAGYRSGFSQLKALEFFVFRKMSRKRKNHLLCGWYQKNVIQNNHHSFYNEGVQAIKIRKNGDYNG